MYNYTFWINAFRRKVPGVMACGVFVFGKTGYL